MEQAKLSSRIKVRARVVFPWLAASKSGIAIQRATKSHFAYTVSSARSSTNSLSLDQPVIEQPAMPQRRSEELYQRDQKAIHLTSQLPILPALERFDCDLILKTHFDSYKTEQNSVVSLRQAISPALPKTASDRVGATAELLEIILLSVPMRKLFVLQRVSRSWEQAIAQSMAIQQKMFLHCGSKRRDIWEMVDEQLNRVPIIVTESDVTDWDYVIGTRMNGKRREPDHKQYVKLRRLDQTGAPIEGQDHLILPLTLNPHLRSSASKGQRWPLVEMDEHGAYSAIRHANLRLMEDCQRVTFFGSVATMKRVAAMYLSDPPWPAATMEITIFCGERGAERHPGFIEAVNHGIDLVSESGLKMADVLRGLSQRGAYYSEIIHGPLSDDSDSDLEPWSDTFWCMKRVTMAEMVSKVKSPASKGMRVKRAIKVTL